GVRSPSAHFAFGEAPQSQTGHGDAVQVASTCGSTSGERTPWRLRITTLTSVSGDCAAGSCAGAEDTPIAARPSTPHTATNVPRTPGRASALEYEQASHVMRPLATLKAARPAPCRPLNAGIGRTVKAINPLFQRKLVFAKYAARMIAASHS